MKMKCTLCPHRRSFLKKGLVASPLLLGGIVPGLAFLSSCGKAQDDSSGGGTTPTPTPVDNSPSNEYTLSFTDYPKLKTTGGSVNVLISASSGKKNLCATRVSDSSAIAVSTTCTNSGCTVGSYNSSTMRYTCPCHGSVYNSDGSVASGPAPSSLQSYAGTITSTGIQFTIN